MIFAFSKLLKPKNQNGILGGGAGVIIEQAETFEGDCIKHIGRCHRLTSGVAIPFYPCLSLRGAGCQPMTMGYFQ